MRWIALVLALIASIVAIPTTASGQLLRDDTALYPRAIRFEHSSPMVVSPDGASVLELATDYDGTVCKTYFATQSS